MRRGLIIGLGAAILLIGMGIYRSMHPLRPAGTTTKLQGSRLTIAQSVDMESMEPDNLNSASSINIANLLWVRLLQVTPQGTLVPYLADSFHWNAAGTEISFDLKPGLHCADGSPLTAKDVVYTFHRAADPKLAFYGNLPSFVYSSIGYVGARQDGALKATVLVKGYSSEVPGMLAEAHILCESDYGQRSAQDAALHPAATGPYRLAEWVRDDRVVLVPNEHYTLAHRPFAQLIFRVIPEASTRAAELIAGSVDLITNVAPDQVATINISGSATVKAVEGTRRMFVGFNLSPAFASTAGGAVIQNKAVRQALEYAVDVPTICAQLLQTPCHRMTGPANLPDPKQQPYPYDPDKAEALLDTAGYKRGADGVRFRLTLQGPNGRYLEDANVAQAVAQFLDDVGVETKVELMDFNSVFLPRSRRHEVGPLYFQGQGGATWSALFGMSLFASRTAGVNTGEWFNPEWQKEFDGLKNVRDPAAERVVIDHMLDVFRDDAPWIFLYFQPDFYGVGTHITWQPRRDELIDVMAIQPKQ